MAQRLYVNEREVVEMEQRLSTGDLSTDVPIGQGEGVTLLHFLPDERQNPEECLADAQCHRVLKERMEAFTKDLKDKELVIFRERLLADELLSLREIGERCLISRERVWQIEQRIKKKLKAYLSKEFRELMETRSGVGVSCLVAGGVPS